MATSPALTAIGRLHCIMLGLVLGEGAGLG